MIVKGELKDRSQFGNKSCFRNERHNNAKFLWKPEWILPQTGNFEFDFVSLVMNRPSPEEEVPFAQFDMLLNWFAAQEKEMPTN